MHDFLTDASATRENPDSTLLKFRSLHGGSVFDDEKVPSSKELRSNLTKGKIGK